MSETLQNQHSILKVKEAQLQNSLAIIMAELKANNYELSVISKAITYYEKLDKQAESFDFSDYTDNQPQSCVL